MSNCVCKRGLSLSIAVLKPAALAAFCLAAAAPLNAQSLTTSYGTARVLGMDIKPDGTVVTVGPYQGTVDFNPSPEETILSSVSGAYYVVTNSVNGATTAFSLPFATQDVALDGDGNLVVVGNFTGTVDLDPSAAVVNLTATPYGNGVVAHYTPSGTLLSYAHLSSSGFLTISRVLIDAQGNWVVGGRLPDVASDFNVASPGTAVISSNGGYDMFLARYSPTATYLSAVAIGLSQSDDITDMALDNDGNVVLVGGVNGTGDLDPGPGTANRTGAGSSDIFIGRYTPSGGFLSAIVLGASGNDVAKGVAVDADNNAVVVGNFLGTVDFDSGSGVETWTSKGGTDAFVARYAPDGSMVSSAAFGGTANDEGTRVMVDNSGNAVVAGLFRNTVDFNPGIGVTSRTAASTTASDLFYARYAANGAFLNATGIGGTMDETVTRLIKDVNGNAVMGGSFRGTVDFDPTDGVAEAIQIGNTHNAYVVRYTPSGTLTSGIPVVPAGKPFTLGSFGGEVGNAVGLDARGNTVIAGACGAPFDFDPGPMRRNDCQYADAFIARYKPSNELISLVRFGGSRSSAGVRPFGLVVDANDNVIVVGVFSGRQDFDPGPASVSYTSAGGNDVFVASYSPSGTLNWVNVFGSTAMDLAWDVALDGAGNAVVAGEFWGTVNVNPSGSAVNLTSAGGPDAFVIRYNASTGAHVSSFRVGGPNRDAAHGVAVDANNDVVLAGGFESTVPFSPTESRTAALNSQDGMVARYTSAGALVWVATFGAGDFDRAYGVALTSTGDAVVTGLFIGTVDFDPGAGVASRTSNGRTDGFVARYTSGGALASVATFGSTGDDAALAAKVDASGNAVVSGTFESTVDFDPGAGVRNLTSAGYTDAFVARYNAAGQYLNAAALNGRGRVFGDQLALTQHNLSLVLDASGNAILVGSFDYEIDMDPTAADDIRPATGSADIFVARITANGELAQTVTGQPVSEPIAVGGASRDITRSVLKTTNGAILAGIFNGTIDFDPGVGVQERTSNGGDDVFLAHYDTEGAFVWAVTFGGTGDDNVRGLGLDPSGNVVAVGTFLGTSDFDAGAGTASRTSAGDEDGYVVRYGPSGQFVSVATLGGTGKDWANGLVVHPSGDVFVIGNFTGTADFSSTPGANQRTSAGDWDVFFASYTPDGTFASSFSVGGVGKDEGNAIGIDRNGNLVAAGAFAGTVDFNPGAGTFNRTAFGGAADVDVFTMRYTTAGELVSGGTFGNASNNRGIRVQVGPSGNLAVMSASSGAPPAARKGDAPNRGAAYGVAGDPSMTATLSQVDDTETLVTEFTLQGINTNAPLDFAVDPSGNFLVAGSFVGTVDLDPTAGVDEKTSSGGSDVFVASYTPTGTVNFANAFGGSGEDVASAISTDANGAAMVVGSFTGSADLGNGTQTSNGAEDMFAVQIGPSGNPLPVELASFSAQVDGSSVRLMWSTVSETNNLGFVVQRRQNDRWVAASALIAGHGTTTERSAYTFDVPGLTAGQHAFRLQQIDTDGTVAYSSMLNVEVKINRALRATLLAGTRLRIETDAPQRVQVQMFDVLGRVLQTEAIEVDGTTTLALPAGLATGKYFVRVASEGCAEVLSFLAF